MSWAAAIGAAVSGLFNRNATRQTNNTNASIAGLNNETAINLANTAHQREVEDLKQAGLNPILSAGGQGAATPALQQAQMQAPQYNFDSIINAIGTMGQYEKSKAEIKNIDANTSKTNIEAEIAPRVAEAQIKLQNAQGDLTKQKKIREELETEIDKIQKKYYEESGTAPNMPHTSRELKGLYNTAKQGIEKFTNSILKDNKPNQKNQIKYTVNGEPYIEYWDKNEQLFRRKYLY